MTMRNILPICYIYTQGNWLWMASLMKKKPSKIIPSMILVGMVVLLSLLYFKQALTSVTYNSANKGFYTTLTIWIILLIIIFALVIFNIIERWRYVTLKNDKKATQSKLTKQENMLNRVFDNATIETAILNLDLRFIRVNKTFAGLLGYSDEEMLSMNLKQLLQIEKIEEFTANINQLLKNIIPIFRSTQACRCKNGNIVMLFVSIFTTSNDLGEPEYLIAYLQNVTEIKKNEEQIQNIRKYDFLTGIANRASLEEYIEKHIENKFNRTSISIMIIDIDNLRDINDSLGHEAGDMMITHMADKLRQLANTEVLLARLAGDKFVLVFKNTKKEELISVADTILDTAIRPIKIKMIEVYITVSIGISIYPKDGDNYQNLMKHANLALLRAKDLGRDNYQFFTSDMTKSGNEKLNLRNLIGNALSKDEFFLHYQLIIGAATQKVSGVEALLRWKNSELYNVKTSEIIAIIEETGMILAVSDWIFKTVCKQLKTWQASGLKNLAISINCSIKQLKQENFVSNIQSLLLTQEIPANCIEIDVTEDSIIQDPKNIMKILHDLHLLGVKIAIDDFCGFITLSHLKKLSFCKIKMSNILTSDVTADELHASIVTLLISTADKLGITTLAKCIETEEQYKFFVNAGCKELQGYYFAKPFDEEAMMNYLLTEAQSV